MFSSSCQSTPHDLHWPKSALHRLPLLCYRFPEPHAANRAMKSNPNPNGLSARANLCLSTAGIPAEKEAVLRALKTGALYPFFRPTLYGKKTHQEVCRWAALGE